MLNTIFLLDVLLLAIIPLASVKTAKELSLIIHCLMFLIALCLWPLGSIVKISTITGGYGDILEIFWATFGRFNVDMVSYPFLLLTTLLFPFCIIIYWNHKKEDMKGYLLTMTIIHLLLVIIFTTTNLFIFYISFEAILIPMFLLIGKWGYRERKILAAFQFFFYTIIGSFFLLMGILYIYYTRGTTDIEILYITKFSNNEQLFLFIAFFASFAVKIPMFPFHIWLPEAHVEAPTAGSVLLAGILLKLGIYGFIRFSIPLFPYANSYYYPLIETMAITGIIYSSLSTICQIDLKKVIAYASIAHMNMVVLGLFSHSIIAYAGSMFMMFSHGLVSPALFISIGFLYDRHNSRLIKYYSGLAHLLPLFSIFFMVLTLANFSFPFTSSFVAEFLILLGLWDTSPFATIFASSSVILSLLYSLWLMNRILFGPISPYIEENNDLVWRELNILLPLMFIILFLGILPNYFLSFCIVI
jgi:proton-translocating NADH-quinone oxidoreductase chain M